MRRFFAPKSEFTETTVTLNPEQSKHIRTVLRLSEGMPVNVFDGVGNEYRCKISEIGKKRSLLKVIENTSPAAPESGLDLTIAAALLRGDKFDLVIQKAVELGVTSLAPITTIRSNVRVKHIENKLGRWRKIIIESSKQCGRAKLMEIARPVNFSGFLKTAGGERILFSENKGESFTGLAESKKITAVIGPEGGWDDSEIELATQEGFRIITFGGRILRAETAAISIAVLLQHRFGDFV
jgi:16S rRNA (uracil1498-N3)-methyltransferase